MIKDEANQIGCAMVQFVKSEHRYSLLVCDYSMKCSSGHPVYNSTSDAAASGCQNGKNSNYDGLCSIDEKYSVSDSQAPKVGAKATCET